MKPIVTDPISDAPYWSRRGLKLNGPYSVVLDTPPVGRCNDLVLRNYWTKSSKRYLEYKSFLKAQLQVPHELVAIADGLIIEAEFALPKSCLNSKGDPNKEGLRRLNGEVKSLPVDWDNLAKPVQDAVAENADGQVKDASFLNGSVSKRWGLRNSITVWLLVPVDNWETNA